MKPNDDATPILHALQNRAFAKACRLMAQKGLTRSTAMPFILLHALALIGMEAWDEAAPRLAEAHDLYPSNGLICLNLALAKEKLGATAEAIALFQESLTLDIPLPSQGAAWLSLSHLYLTTNESDLAQRAAEKAASLGAPRAEVCNSIGLALKKKGLFEAARRKIEEATQLAPVQPLFWLNLANLAFDIGDDEKAWPLFAKARGPHDFPLACRDEAMARLLSGDFTEGWRLYEKRLLLPHAFQAPEALPRYAGESLDGKKILLVAEQGFGDTIHFCRYASLLKEKGATLAFAVQPALTQLLRGSLNDEVVALGSPLPNADFYLPLLSLPFACGMKELPCRAVPYLKPPAEGPLLPTVKQGAQKIGLVWRGSPTHARDAERSIPLALLAPLFETAQKTNTPVSFFSLLPKLGEEKQTMESFGIHDLSPHLNDFADTAFLLSQLDALISVDTATAHLAGALGLRTHLFLPWVSDWRWGKTGDRTSLYPQTTLLRQESFNDWRTPLERLVKEIFPIAA